MVVMSGGDEEGLTRGGCSGGSGGDEEVGW